MSKKRDNQRIVWQSLIKCLKSNLTVSSSEILQLLEKGEAKTVEDVVKIMQEKYGKDSK